MWTTTPARERKKPRIREGEDFNREGHWCRDFSVRTDCWGVIEHWAAEHGYFLVAMKGKRRQYQKGEDKLYSTVIDIRHQDNRVVMSSWVQVGFQLRMATLFLLPEELPIDPFGWKGIRVRRQACADLNALLTRLRQPEIAGSGGFHFLDLHMSTLVLVGVLPVPLIYFVMVGLLRFEAHPGLTNILLETFGKTFAALLGTAGTLLLIHHFAIARRLSTAISWVSTSVSSIFFTVLCAFLLTHTVSEMLEKRVTHHCIMHFSEQKCSSNVGELSVPNREKLLKRLEIFEKHLSTTIQSPSNVR